MNFIGYEKCSTCKKAQSWLKNKAVEVDFRDIKGNKPTEKELKKWIKKSGVDIKKFFNTSGMKYRELDLAKKLPQMNEEEKVKLLASDGMLVKRPLLILEDTVLIGFKEKEWENHFKIKSQD